MKKQIVIIHGGETFETQEGYLEFLRNYKIDFQSLVESREGWKSWLKRELKGECDVIYPEMPNPLNAKYGEWKTIFEKLLPYIEDGVILIGHSLGADFLIKYLSENNFPRKIKAVMLIAGCFDKDVAGYGLASFSLPSIFNLQSDKVYLYHSKDDPVVPFSDLEKIHERIPNAVARIFDNKLHFNQETFPELLEDIKSLE